MDGRSVIIFGVGLCFPVLIGAWTLPCCPRVPRRQTALQCRAQPDVQKCGALSTLGGGGRAKTRKSRAADMRMSDELCGHDVDSALSALMHKATFTVQESWRRQEAKGDNAARSASGGTGWADGSWIDAGLESELISMMNSTRHNEAAFAWLKTTPKPVYIQVLESAEATIVLHLIPAKSSMGLPWLRPTGSKVLCRVLCGKMEVVQLLGDPHGRRPMREAVRYPYYVTWRNYHR